MFQYKQFLAEWKYKVLLWTLGVVINTMVGIKTSKGKDIKKHISCPMFIGLMSITMC